MNTSKILLKVKAKIASSQILGGDGLIAETGLMGKNMSARQKEGKGSGKNGGREAQRSRTKLAEMG